MGVTLVGSDVDAWADQSGNGNHVIAPNPANRPTYAATGGPNSQACLQFDGAAEYLNRAAFSWGAACGAHTMAIVAKITTYVASERWVDYAGTAFIRSGATNVIQGARVAVVTGTGTTLLGTVAYHSILYTWDGASQSVYVDNVAEDTDVNAGAAMADAAALGIGGAGGGLFAAIDVAEVVVTRAAFTADERTAFDAYVATRYGI